jgi:glutamyl-tRNA synthetase
MTTTVRFAPSPTGRIHIGNARTAILNWLFARKANGTFILRYDDTDLERSTQEFADGIATDLDWLGLSPDKVFRQSERFALYDAAAEKLKADGRLYACYETAEELEYKRKRQLARGLPPVYDRAGLNLSDDERAKLEAEGRTPHWRFKLDQREIVWNDLVRGETRIDTSSLSDPVLIRGDGSYLYTLPSVVDDIDMGITHVIRGEDHVTNAAVQVELFEALGGTAPGFAHHSLLVGADGKGLSKRLGSLSIAAMREDGLEAMAVVSHGALIGTSEAIEPHTGMDTLLDAFDLSKLSRAPGRFDMAELENLNARIVHELDYADVRERLLSDECRWRRSVLERCSRQPCQGGRGTRLARHCFRRHARRGGGRGPRVHCASRRSAAARAVGRDHLEGLDRCRERSIRPQGQRVVHAAAPCAHRPAARSGTRRPPAADGARKG